METPDRAFLLDLLKEAGEVALAQRGQQKAVLKADLTPVTEADRQVEDLLIRRISSRYPSHVILSEESGLHPAGADFTWVLDPIDGTRAFASGLPVWGVSVGVFQHGKPVLGGFYLPVTRELYWGDGEQAFWNDRPLSQKSPADFEDPLFFLAVPSEFHLHFTTSYPRVRSMGSTAAHLAYAAEGAAVGVLMFTSKLWDLAGMLPVLSAAGVELAYLDGSAFQPDVLMQGQPIRGALLAARPEMMDPLRQRIALL